MYGQDFHRKTGIEMFKTYFINKYLKNYVESYILSQTVFSSNDCKTRLFFVSLVKILTNLTVLMVNIVSQINCLKMLFQGMKIICYF